MQIIKVPEIIHVKLTWRKTLFWNLVKLFILKSSVLYFVLGGSRSNVNFKTEKAQPCSVHSWATRGGDRCTVCHTTWDRHLNLRKSVIIHLKHITAVLKGVLLIHHSLLVRLEDTQTDRKTGKPDQHNVWSTLRMAQQIIDLEIQYTTVEQIILNVLDKFYDISITRSVWSQS